MRVFTPTSFGCLRQDRGANETIIRILSERNMKSFARDHIESARKLSLDATLAGYGMELQQQDAGAGAAKIVVVRGPNETQRRLLGCLGYKK